MAPGPEYDRIIPSLPIQSGCLSAPAGYDVPYDASYIHINGLKTRISAYYLFINNIDLIGIFKQVIQKVDVPVLTRTA
jgi:hypothetical protein